MNPETGWWGGFDYSYNIAVSKNGEISSSLLEYVGIDGREDIVRLHTDSKQI